MILLGVHAKHAAGRILLAAQPGEKLALNPVGKRPSCVAEYGWHEVDVARGDNDVTSRSLARPGDQQRDSDDRFIKERREMPEHAALEQLAVIGSYDQVRAIGQALLLERLNQAPELCINVRHILIIFRPMLTKSRRGEVR